MSGKQGRRLLGATVHVLLCLFLLWGCFYVSAVLVWNGMALEAQQPGRPPPR